MLSNQTWNKMMNEKVVMQNCNDFPKLYIIQSETPTNLIANMTVLKVFR